MKKKIMAACLASALIVASAPASYAVIPPEFVGLAQGALSSISAIEVPTDIKLKDSSDVEFQNGPINISNKDVSTASFDFRAEIAMSGIKDAMADYVNKTKIGLSLIGYSDTDIQDALSSCYVKSGQFQITVTYPTTGITIPAAFTSGTGMANFTSKNGKHNDVFNETARTSDSGKTTITIDVKGGTTLTLDELNNNLDDLILTCEGVTVSELGTYKVVGEVTGKTTISSNSDVLGDVTYKFVQGNDTALNMEKDKKAVGDEISGTVIVKTSSSGGSLGGDVSSTTKKDLTIVFGEEFDDCTLSYPQGTVVSFDSIPVPANHGFKIEGYYSDPDFSDKLDDNFTLNDHKKIYAKWVPASVVPVLNYDEHFAYIIGYPTDDAKMTVRPDESITREEIATIFYRLLTDESRANLLADANSFVDVASDRWSNRAISTMANGGILLGYHDNTFKPANEITRAEFITIATRFYDIAENTDTESKFNDIDDHWAKENIDSAVAQGWIDGYSDGTFRPDRSITRAEVIKIINNILGRKVDENGLIEGIEEFADVDQGAWYYYDVIEATHSHEFERAETETVEKWTKLVPNKTWN